MSKKINWIEVAKAIVAGIMAFLGALAGGA